jgi:hypothetical protein
MEPHFHFRYHHFFFFLRAGNPTTNAFALVSACLDRGAANFWTSRDWTQQLLTLMML